jgi:hypothetical protein
LCLFLKYIICLLLFEAQKVIKKAFVPEGILHTHRLTRSVKQGCRWNRFAPALLILKLTLLQIYKAAYTQASVFAASQMLTGTE